MPVSEQPSPDFVIRMCFLPCTPSSRRHTVMGVSRQIVREQHAARRGAIGFRPTLHECHNRTQNGVRGVKIRAVHSEYVVTETHDDGPVPRKLATVPVAESEPNQMSPKPVGIAWPRMKIQRQLFGPAPEPEETP